jgi:hypothetical protein
MNIVNLPQEIFSLILGYVFSDPSCRRVEYLTICKSWNSSAVRCFYETTELDLRKIVQVSDEGRRRNLRHTRNLLLLVHSPGIYFDNGCRNRYGDNASNERKPALQASSQYVCLLERLLKAAQNLRTLRYYGSGPFLGTELRGMLVSVRSCRPHSLELDLCGTSIQPTSVCDDDPATWPQHLCAILNDILYDVPHVRLRVPRLCPRIFRSTTASRTSRLQSLVISFLDSQYQMMCFHCCRDGRLHFDRCVAAELQQHAKLLIDVSPKLNRLRVVSNDLLPWGIISPSQFVVVDLITALWWTVDTDSCLPESCWQIADKC